MGDLRKETNLEANTVKQILVIGDFREVISDLTASRQEHAIGHFPVE